MKQDEEERRGAGAVFPFGKALRGLEFLRGHWLVRAVLGNAVGKGLFLGLALVAATFGIVKLAEVSRSPQPAPADRTYFADRGKTSAARVQWGLINEGMSASLPARNSMWVEPEPGASSDSAGHGPQPPPDAQEPEQKGEEASAEAGRARRAARDELAKALAAGMGSGGGTGGPGFDGAEGMSGGLAGLRLGGAKRIADSQGFVKPFSAPSLAHSRMKAMGGRSKRAVVQGSRAARRGASDRASGQLKLARRMSALGKTAGGNEGAAAYADAAFNQQEPAPQGLFTGEAGRGTGGAGLGANAGSGGGGASQSLAPGEMTQPPEMPAPEDKTPYGGELKQAEDLSDAARRMKDQGTLLIAVGVVLIAAGAYIGGYGYLLVLIGLFLVYQGWTMIQQGDAMADQAKAIGERIENDYGQQDQGEIVQDDAEAARRRQDYTPPATEVQRGDAGGDADREREGSYRME